MLSRRECMELLAWYGKGAEWTKHCFAVAGSVARVAQVLESRSAIDHHFLWSAAMLHDIGRCVTHDPIMHGVEGYNLLTRLGHEAEAFVCASHILFGLDAAEAPRFGLPSRDFLPRTIEERLVPLVDFMVEGDRPTSLDLRFASLRARNFGNDFFLERLDRAHGIAKSFLMQLSEEMGESLEDLVAWHGHGT